MFAEIPSRLRPVDEAEERQLAAAAEERKLATISENVRTLLAGSTWQFAATNARTYVRFVDETRGSIAIERDWDL